MRADLPTGTVTLLFTDVEGSTTLLNELGAERYAELLADHRRVARQAFAAHGGVEVDTQGDAFFVAFRDPRAAALAGASVLASLQLDWPRDAGARRGVPRDQRRARRPGARQ